MSEKLLFFKTLNNAVKVTVSIGKSELKVSTGITTVNGMRENSQLSKKEGFSRITLILGSLQKSSLFGSGTRRKLGPLGIAGFLSLKNP